MSFYNFDIKQRLIDLLPPDKRYLKNIALAQSLLSVLKWIHDKFFSSYYEGSAAPNYAAGVYNYLDEVKYNKKIYLSLIDNNTDTPTTDNWMLILNTFIGVKERLSYNGQKIILECALNKEFDSIFRQPPNTSDIYITRTSSVLNGFFIGQTEPYCSSIGQTTASDYIGSNSLYVYLHNFQVNIPLATLDISIDSNYKAVANFINQYIPLGLKFTIVNY
jgi:hypothetical protein